MCAEIVAPQERVDMKLLNVELANELRKFSKFVSKVSFLGELIVVHLNGEPKRKVELLQIDMSRAISDKLFMEFQFFRGVNREWWFRRA